MRTLLPLLFLVFVTSLVAEKPFDFASTPGKLPKNIRPLEYAISIQPDLKNLTFSGCETVKLQLEQPAREIIFNAADMTVSEARLDDKVVPPSAIKLDKKRETVTITFAEDLLAGEHTLDLKFAGRIVQYGRGFFYAKYQEPGSGAKKMLLGTQFEPTDARRFFPCWDEPSFRAKFQLTATVPENWMAVSNMPVASERKVNGGREVHFQPTPAMASYLNVFCAGEFDAVESEIDGVKLRVITTKNNAEKGRYALESTKQILHYYNDYFGVAYPLPKLDQIALPGGFGGAMENWGGITYYETALLFDPQTSSVATRQRVFEVIAHEVAHQWFGDLVTMAWWDNLWLNEGFASWMGAKCTTHFNPRWEVWLEKGAPRDPMRRIGIAKEQAMEGDARNTTHPIQQVIANEGEANNAFDDITYKKGQSFLRMLENFLGEDAFRTGIRAYIKVHQYSNSTTADLWNSLTEASGKPVADIAAGWTQQPGFPVVTVKRESGDNISLTQERFAINFRDNTNEIWKIPLTYFIAGQSAPATLLMPEKTAQLENVPVDRALKLNVDGAGNYRVAYDDPSWKLLLAALPGMNVPEKVNLLSDAWAFVQQGSQPFSFYTELIARIPPGAELAEREQIMSAFDFIDHLLLPTPERDKFFSYARGVLRPTLDSSAMLPKPDEAPMISLLRASLVQMLGLFGDQDVIRFCRQNFQSYLKDPAKVAPDLRGPTFAVVMRNGDATTWEQLHSLGLKTASTEEKQTFYEALAFSTDPALIKKTLALTLTDELPTSRAVYLLSKVARESGHSEMAWQFALANQKLLAEKVDALGANTYFPGLFLLFSDPARIDELKSFAQKYLGEASARPVATAADEIQFRHEFRQRLSQQIDALK